jgi:C-terminal processing protease CtpA/Prc
MERLSATQGRADVPHIEPENLFILVDQGTGSSAEIFATTLRTLAGAQLIGERTVGAELPVVTLEAPDGSRFAVGGLGGMTDPCDPFQGTGLEPDIRVELTAPDEAGLGPRQRRERLRLMALQSALGLVDGVEP